jgi:hypothetical protein
MPRTGRRQGRVNTSPLPFRSASDRRASSQGAGGDDSRQGESRSETAASTGIARSLPHCPILKKLRTTAGGRFVAEHAGSMLARPEQEPPMPLAPEAEGKRPALEPSGPGKAGRTGRTHLRAVLAGGFRRGGEPPDIAAFSRSARTMDSRVVWLQSGLKNSDSIPCPVSSARKQSRNNDTANPLKSYESPSQKPQRADKQRISDDRVCLIPAATVFGGRHGARDSPRRG